MTSIKRLEGQFIKPQKQANKPKPKHDIGIAKGSIHMNTKRMGAYSSFN